MKAASKKLLVSMLLIMSSFMTLNNSREPDIATDIENNHVLAQTNILEDSGFESGGFSVWTNELDTTTNTVQSAVVNSRSRVSVVIDRSSVARITNEEIEKI